jgi:hypothetical protein
MDPVSERRAIAAVLKPLLVVLVLVFVAGAYLGRALASGFNQGSLASLFAFFGVLIVGAVLAVMALVAAILAKSPDESGHRAARSIFVAGLVFVGGIAIGWAVEPAFRPVYRESVVLGAPGTLNVSIDGLDSYRGAGTVAAGCTSELDAEGIADVRWGVVGTFETAVVGASIAHFADSADGRPVIQIWIERSFEDKAAEPVWTGPADVIQRTAGDRTGRLVFKGATFPEPDKPPYEGYPLELSGTMSWSCGEWLRPSAPVATPR